MRALLIAVQPLLAVPDRLKAPVGILAIFHLGPEAELLPDQLATCITEPDFTEE